MCKLYHPVFGKENIKEIFKLLYTKLPCQSYSTGSKYGKHGICRVGTLRNLRDYIGKNSDIDINCIDSGSMFIRLYKAQSNSIEAIIIKHCLQWSNRLHYMNGNSFLRQVCYSYISGQSMKTDNVYPEKKIVNNKQ